MCASPKEGESGAIWRASAPTAALFLAVALAPLGLSRLCHRSRLPTYKQEMGKLDAEGVRGGILTPSGRQISHPQTDYVCKISGGASRIS